MAGRRSNPLPPAAIVEHAPIAVPQHYRHARLADQLHRHLVEADLRSPLVVGAVVDLQYVLQAGHGRAVGPRRDHPLLLEVRLSFVFFRARRALSSLTASPTPPPPTFSPPTLLLHRPPPPRPP